MPYIVNEIIGENAWFGILPSEDMYMEIWMLGIFISLLFIAMSKEKTEDEMIMQIRLKSVFFSLWFTSVLFVVETLFFFQHCLCLQSLGHSLCIADCLYHKVPLRNSST